MMHDFELIKREFDGDSSEQYTCDLPGVLEDPDNNIEEDYVKVTG